MKLFDTNVLIYGFDPNSPFHLWAKTEVMRGVLEREALVNPIVLAELSVGDETPETLPERLLGLGLSLIDLPWEASLAAGEAFAMCLRARRASAETAPRTPLPDFFIGAHAQLLSCPVVTADEGRYRTYFPEVELILPP